MEEEKEDAAGGEGSLVDRSRDLDRPRASEGTAPEIEEAAGWVGEGDLNGFRMAEAVLGRAGRPLLEMREAFWSTSFSGSLTWVADLRGMEDRERAGTEVEDDEVEVVMAGRE
jgi:hypothetical protein